MYKFRGKGSLKGVELIGFYTDNQVQKDDKGNVRGVMINFQVNQAGYTKKGIKEGTAKGASGFPNIAQNKDGFSVFYPKTQFERFTSVCTPMKEGAYAKAAEKFPEGYKEKNVIAFKADLKMAKDKGYVVSADGNIEPLDKIASGKQTPAYIAYKHNANASFKRNLDKTARKEMETGKEAPEAEAEAEAAVEAEV